MVVATLEAVDELPQLTNTYNLHLVPQGGENVKEKLNYMQHTTLLV